MNSIEALWSPPEKPSGGGPAAGRGRSPTDGELQAYVDGALDDARAIEVEAALRRDPGMRRTVHVYSMLNQVVRLLYDAVLTEPAPDALRRVTDKRCRH